jgi:hypothetical protein
MASFDVNSSLHGFPTRPLPCRPLQHLASKTWLDICVDWQRKSHAICNFRTVPLLKKRHSGWGGTSFNNHCSWYQASSSVRALCLQAIDWNTQLNILVSLLQLCCIQPLTFAWQNVPGCNAASFIFRIVLDTLYKPTFHFASHRIWKGCLYMCFYTSCPDVLGGNSFANVRWTRLSSWHMIFLKQGQCFVNRGLLHKGTSDRNQYGICITTYIVISKWWMREDAFMYDVIIIASRSRSL